MVRKVKEQSMQVANQQLNDSPFKIPENFCCIIKFIQHYVNYPSLFKELWVNINFDCYINVYKFTINTLVKKLDDKKDCFSSLVEDKFKLEEKDIKFLINIFVDNNLKEYFFTNSVQLLSKKYLNNLYYKFFYDEKEMLFKKLTDKNVLNRVENLEEYIEVLAMYLSLYLDINLLYKLFENYVDKTVAKVSQKSVQVNNINFSNNETEWIFSKSIKITNIIDKWNPVLLCDKYDEIVSTKSN